jgi:hypothetical protein
VFETISIVTHPTLEENKALVLIFALQFWLSPVGKTQFMHLIFRESSWGTSLF